MSSPRTTPVVGLVITALAVPYSAAQAVTDWEPASGWLPQSVIHLGELLVVVALAISGAAGRSLVARAGLGAAIIGQAVLAAAEVIWPHSPDLGDTLFTVGPLLTGVGMVVAGIAVIRARRSTGWHRVIPLILGCYIFVVMVPALAATGGPPASIALWALTGWDVLWVLVAASVLAKAPAPAAVQVARS